MTVHLDWQDCQPRADWEVRLHQMLDALSKIKPLSHARIDVTERARQSPRFTLSIELQLPGPDISMECHGQTFDEALRKADSRLRLALAARAARSKHLTSAVLGVKAIHRG
jgi:hypothetical protein